MYQRIYTSFKYIVYTCTSPDEGLLKVLYLSIKLDIVKTEIPSAGGLIKKISK